MEVTQATQTASSITSPFGTDGVPLVSGKKTVVRIYPQVARWRGGGAVTIADIQLVGRHSGSDLPGSPLTPSSLSPEATITVAPDESLDSKRRDLSKTWQFVLPDEWAQPGEISLIARINATRALTECARCSDDNTFVRTHVQFSLPRTFNIVPVKINNGGMVIPDSAITPALEGIRRSYPVTTLNVLPSRTLNTSAGGGDLLDEIADAFTCFDGGDFSGPVWDWLQGCSWSTYFVGLLPSCPGGRGYDEGPACWAGATPWTTAQEVGHNLGRNHASNAHGESGGGEVDRRYPDPHGSITEFGFDTTAMQLIPPTAPFPMGLPTDDSTISGAASGCYQCDPSSPSDCVHAHDFMSYGNGPFWISPYTWQALFNHPLSGGPPAKSSHTVSTSALQSDSGEYLRLSGQFRQDGTLELFPFYQGRLPAGRGVRQGLGPYTVELHAGDGRILFVGNFDLTRIEGDAQIRRFTAVIPFPATTARVVFKQGSTLLASRDVSPHAPVVTLLSPNGGEFWPAISRPVIAWSGTDADGDDLTYALQYSSDSGNTWQMIASQLKQTRYEVDASWLAGSASARVRVIATDGVNTSRDASDSTFTIQRKAPRASILAPTNKATLSIDQLIVFEGTASDYEDGMIPDEALMWLSDRDGRLGIGRRVNVKKLSPGVHTITLLARDSDGFEGRASITVRVPTVLTLGSVTGLEGTVVNTGQVLTQVGIAVGNSFPVGQPPREQALRGFLSFDVTRIPAGAELLAARLEIYQSSITGDPYFKGLGSVTADLVQYGSSLDAADFNAPTLLGNIGTLADNGLLAYKVLDVSQAVKAAMRNRLSLAQFRLRFVRESDGDYQIDTVQFESTRSARGTTTLPRLSILYVPAR